MKTITGRMVLAVPLLACLALTGCVLNVGDKSGKVEEPGPTEHSTQIVAKEKAKGVDMVRVNLHLGAGELRLQGGAKELFEGNFAYNVPSWKPDVRYEASGFRGTLTVRQGSGSSGLGNAKNEWDLKLSNDVPYDLSVECGAGDNRFDLRELTLRSVEMTLGAGQVDMDLRGHPKKDYDVSIKGGVGEATVRLPSDVGVVAEAHGGLGSVNVRGLTKDGSEWRNSLYGKAPATIRVNVEGGIGEINILAE